MRGVLCVLALAGCTPAKTSSSLREVPVTGPATLSCSSDAPMECPAGCCESGDSCGVGGCDLPPTSPSCSADSPVYCSTSRAADSSPNGNDLSLLPPADFVVGRFASGVSVECAKNSSCPPTISGTLKGVAGSGLTIEAWVRSTVADGSVMSIVSLNGIDLALSPDSQPSTLWLFGASGEYALHGLPRFDDAWHFVAVTLTSPSTPPSFFLDWAALGAGTAESGTSAASTGVIIGNNTDGSRPFFGGIDEVRVLGAVATASQIAGDFANGPMTAIPGTLALWHFDDSVQGWCCASDATCGTAAGDCLAPTAGPAACPSSAPVACGSGCCPPGSTCDVSGSCNVGVSACPASAPVDCGGGSCCGAGYACDPSGCVLNPPTPAPSPACPAGTSPATNSTTECCPSSMSAVYCSGKCVPGSSCGTVACTASCTNGYSCVCQAPNPCSPCEGAAAATLCASLCGGKCCGPGETCTSSGKCCPAGTSPCGAACCPSSQCTAGTCTTAKTPIGSCPANTTACGDSCCPSGSLCTSGTCLAVPQPATYCTRGLACGGQCCLGVSCSAAGECIQLAVTPFGPCLPGCYGGRAASVGGGRSAPLVCHCNAKKPPTVSCSDAKAPTACGTSCCGAGGRCENGRCGCPADHPESCGGNCCLTGGACHGGECDCPTGRATCGTACCASGQVCVNGACQAGPTGSTTSSGGGDCAAFGQQNCNPSSGARCYQGHCQCCYAQCGSSGGACSCLGCDSACSGSGYDCSSDGICLEVPPLTAQGPACSN